MVAIKVYANVTAAKRKSILREASLLQKLGQHPNIPMLYGVIDKGGSQIYLVMEYVKGSTLTSYLLKDKIT